MLFFSIATKLWFNCCKHRALCHSINVGENIPDVNRVAGTVWLRLVVCWCMFNRIDFHKVRYL